MRPISRPTHHQREAYNGHKRTHAIKFQSVLSPDGLIIDLHGPEAGKRHDAYLFAVSGLQQVLEEHCVDGVDGVPYMWYGDPAYPRSAHLGMPFMGALLAPGQADFNRRMSAVREAVEWGFGKVTQYFRYIDFKPGLKVLLSPVGKYYRIAVLLANSHTCLNGSQVSEYFDCHPPTLEDYYRTATDQE